jgi:hypothetical protein
MFLAWPKQTVIATVYITHEPSHVAHISVTLKQEVELVEG